jgi:hypothetical protein
MIERAAFLSVEAAKVNARIASGTSTPISVDLGRLDESS